jgi:cardiolipin synthase
MSLKQMNNPKEQKVLALSFNVPNAITAVRIILVVPIAWLLCREGTAEVLLAGILLSIAWATDGLDGFVARRLRQSSLAGALFDLVADRVLMTPILILAIAGGLWSRTAALMPFNPYPYAAIVIAGDFTILVGVFTFMWKRHTHAIEFPAPTQIAKITYSVQMLTLVVGILGIGPNMLLAALMYLTIIFTLLSFYSYLRKASYVFTR